MLSRTANPQHRSMSRLPGADLSPMERLSHWRELFTEIRLDELLNSATAAALRAYSPYSQFRVGAAVLADGVQHLGCNIENASYGLTMCAERVALYNGIAAGHRAINALAVNCLDANV